MCIRDSPCDVDDEGNLFVGSIAVCKKRAAEQAEEYGHSYRRELNYLLVHGIMHCLGYDHMTEEEMCIRDRQGAARKRLIEE